MLTQPDSFTGPMAPTCPGCGFAVPLDEAVVAEAVDYVLYFCGHGCFERWSAAASTYLHVQIEAVVHRAGSPRDRR